MSEPTIALTTLQVTSQQPEWYRSSKKDQPRQHLRTVGEDRIRH
ncbi:hypothetical protein [Mycobacterium sp.]|nr:hypothetical protein [Mycobacterium sp.]HZA11553.1 hypothetical protein [Mycobacterium sp.]